MDELTLKRVRKKIRNTEEELVEAELNNALWEWAGEAAVSEFRRSLLPRFRRVDRLRAAVMEQLSRKNGLSFGFGYRFVAAAAREYAANLLEENEIEFTKRVIYRPCQDCLAIYMRAVKQIYSNPGCCAPNRDDRESLIFSLNHALMASNIKELEALEKKAGRRQLHLFENEMKARFEVSPKREEQLLGRLDELESERLEILRRPGCVLFRKITDAYEDNWSYLDQRASKLDEWAVALELKLEGECISKLAAYGNGSGTRHYPENGEGYFARCLDYTMAEDSPGVKKEEGSIFKEMVNGNQMTVARLLISHPLLAYSQDELGRTPLHIAALNGWPAIVDALLVLRAEVEAKTTGRDAAKGIRLGETPLMEALKAAPVYGPLTLEERMEARKHRNCLKCVKILLDAGAKTDDADEKGNSPLIQAIDSHNIRGFEMLLDAGADPGFCPNEYGFTPLHEIAVNYREDRWKKTHLDMARMLLERGADPLAWYSARKWAKDWEKHWKENDLPEPQGWVNSRDRREDETPLDLAEKGSELFRMLQKAYVNRKKGSSSERPLNEAVSP